MKKIKSIVMALSAILWAGGTLSAQTPNEIIEKMSAEMERGETEGFTMDLTMKIPIVGTITAHNMILGKKIKTVVKSPEKSDVSWTDGTTKWTYDEKNNEITITAAGQTEGTEGEPDISASAFNNPAEGYDCQIIEDNSEAWYLACKKSKSNKSKDDPKKMDLGVSKATYLPVYIKTKKSIVTISFENFSLGVSEESVTFNPAEYPDAKIVDKR